MGNGLESPDRTVCRLEEVKDFKEGQSFICSDRAVWLVEKLMPVVPETYVAVIQRMGGKFFDLPGLGDVEVLHTRMPEPPA